MTKKRKPRYEMWVEEGKSPIAPEIRERLPKHILELALIEDVTGPSLLELKSDEYIARLAPRLRGPLVEELRAASLVVAEPELAEICRLAASETFVIRGLNAARLYGEIPLKDIRKLPFYPLYRDYFEQTPGIVARAIEIAISAVAAIQSEQRDATNN